MHELRSRTVRALGWTLTQGVVAKFLSFAILALLGRLLDPAAFGTVALAATFTAFLEIWVTQGFADFVVQVRELDQRHVDTAFWVNVAIGTVLAGGLFAAAPALAGAFKTKDLVPVVQWLSSSVLLRSLNTVQTGILRREFRYRVLAMRTTLCTLAGGAIGVVTAFLGWGAMSLVAQTVAVELLSTVALWTASSFRPGFAVSGPHLRELVRFGGHMFGASLLLFGSRRLDGLIIAHQLGAAQLGAYSLGQRTLQTTTSLLIKSGESIAFNNLSRLQDDHEARRRTYYASVEFMMLVSLPAFVGVSVVAPDFVRAVFGPQWTTSADILRVLSLAGIAYAGSYINGAALKAAGQTSSLLFLHVVLSVLYLSMLFALIRWGVLAMASAYVLSITVVHPVELYLLRRSIGIRYADWLGAVTPLLLAALLMGVGVWSTRTYLIASLDHFAALAVCVPLGAVLYVASVRLFAPSTLDRALGAAKYLRRGAGTKKRQSPL